MVRLSLAFFAVALCLRGTLTEEGKDGLEEHWVTFKEMYNKTYENPDEEEEARQYFKDNALDVMLHNMDDENTYVQTIHEHSDKSTEEAIEILCGTDVPPEEQLQNRTRRNFLVSERLSQPSKDWRAEGKVSEVKQQGSCGSCWAFTAAQCIECQAAIRWGSIWKISEQQLVDCAASYGNNGCDGGWPDNAFRYMINEGGIVMESCYPYTGTVGTCSINSNCYRFQVKDYVGVAFNGNEDAIAEAVAQKGCMAVAIHVNDNFMHYKNGIYEDTTCNKQVNHGVVIVGYGSEAGKDYWIVKNSWGPGWGENGYIRMARNAGNTCNICTYASYPLLA